jgi:nitrite reductase/ring-hydroxylating ferredoxin subunit
MPNSDGVSIDQSSAVMLTRYQGQVFALALACPHQNAAVRWLPQEQRFRCSKHDSKYQPTGTYTSGRATRNLDRFPIRRDGDQVIVDISKVFKSDADPRGWTSAALAV